MVVRRHCGCVLPDSASGFVPGQKFGFEIFVSCDKRNDRRNNVKRRALSDRSYV